VAPNQEGPSGKAKQVLTEEDIAKAQDRIMDAVLEDYPGAKNLAFIGIITRGATLAARMRDAVDKRLGVRVECGDLDTSPHRDDLKGGAGADRTKIPFSLSDRDVILVDDVMSTGRTIRAAMEAVMACGRPRSIRTAVLIDRGHRELPITADYVGAQVPTSVKEKIRVRLREVDGGRDGAFIAGR
jgi:pyrimidine operon attenuation protein / uracil phosphoribosyltransferase